MLALPVDPEAGFLQRPDRAQVINAGKLRHSLRGDDFHFANFAMRVGFAVDLEIFSNRISDIAESFFNICSLGVASRHFGATH